jgi:putative radical SAM enzyme (TIGR03279 family)
MRKVDTTISYVEPNSIAEEAGLKPGDKLLKINGHDFHDILEYRYLISEYEVTLEVLKQDDLVEVITLETDYEDIGIEFGEGLIDEAQSCHNKCIFCFIDQLPKGMRETVYFKDDDTRLSFLQGNYVTLTNMSDEEIDRLIKMRVSPINVSVHATNPELRCKMLNNRFAGKCYDIMKKFAKNNIYMNCQIVLCPGINDGEELDRSISDMAELFPYVNSVSVVPVGLTRYRDGLYPLTQFDEEGSKKTILQVEEWQNKLYDKLGTRLIYLSDEFYLNANIPIPDAENYEGFPQLENGVGLIASMQEEFDAAIKMVKPKDYNRTVSIATGELAAPFISKLANQLSEKTGVKVSVYAIKNNFFGGGVNVAGLVTGRDLIEQMKDKPRTDIMLIPHSMLRDEDEIFLDDTTLAEVEEALGMKIEPVINDGYEFIEKILGEELEF